jgi:RNA polymerase sigma-70 factor (ECF subfamily)
MASLPEANTSDEIGLLAGVAAGDREAFRQLYARYSAPLFSLAIRLIGDNGAAEEVLQDTFVKIWRHAADYDAHKSRPFTWAVTLLRRTCIDQIRKRRRSPPGVSLPEDEIAPAEFATHETTRQTTEVNETTTRLHSALATVLSPQRDALELALFSTLTHAEIAARLAQPLGTIKTWIRRGLLDLRARLSEPVP